MMHFHLNYVFINEYILIYMRLYMMHFIWIDLQGNMQYITNVNMSQTGKTTAMGRTAVQENWRLSASWGSQSKGPLKPPVHRSIILLRGIRQAP